MDTSKSKPVKVLSLSKQKKSIRGVTKPKKSGTKNALDNPLALEWPDISQEDQQEITHLLQGSCRGLRKIKIMPPWSEVKKHKSGTQRKAFLCKFKEDFMGKLDAGALRREREAATARTHLVLGFNATMRALENDCIAAIAVKSNVSPPFLTKTFLPGCGTKCIPIVPIPDLDSLLRASDGLGLEHSCMSLGLKPVVKERHNRFNALYLKMCAALNIEDDNSKQDDDEEGENIVMEVEVEKDGDHIKRDIKMVMDVECGTNQKNVENEDTGNKENEIMDNEGGKHGEISLHEGNNKQDNFKILSTKEIQSYLLKRSRPDRREFVPGQQHDGISLGKLAGNKNGKQILDSSVGFESDFISLEAGETRFREDSRHKSNSGNVPLGHGNPKVPRFTQKHSDNGSACVPKFTLKESDEKNTPRHTQKEPDKGNTSVPKYTLKDSDKRRANLDNDFSAMFVMDREGDGSCRDAAVMKTCDGERETKASLINTGEGEREVVKKGDWERKGRNNEKDDVGNGQDVCVHKGGENRKTEEEERDRSKKKKNVKRKVKACEYIPAQTKRFKGNPHRKNK